MKRSASGTHSQALGSSVPAQSNFEVEATADDGLVSLVVRDFGRWRKARASDRGLGLHLMHQLMDEVHYEILPDGNLLTMIKRDAA